MAKEIYCRNRPKRKKTGVNVISIGLSHVPQKQQICHWMPIDPHSVTMQ